MSEGNKGLLLSMMMTVSIIEMVGGAVMVMVMVMAMAMELVMALAGRRPLYVESSGWSAFYA